MKEKKRKIAIAINPALLGVVDSKIDGSYLRSRSQAIEHYLLKGLHEESISFAVVMLSPAHHRLALKRINNKTLLENQVEFLGRHGIRQVVVLTASSPLIKKLMLIQPLLSIKTEIKIVNKKGNARALLSLRESLPPSFILFSGDILADFNIEAMENSHFSSHSPVTMGLITSSTPKKYGSVLIEGSSIVKFEEKPKEARSHVINAGIYLFQREALDMIGNKTSIEFELLPVLAGRGMINGFFINGTYLHLG